MWIAELKKIQNLGELIHFTVEFTDGQSTITRVFSLSGSVAPDWLENQCRATIGIFEGISSIASAKTVGLLDLTVPAPTPTATQVAREIYSSNVQKAKHYLEMVRVGIKNTNDSEITTLKNWLVSNYKSDYWDLF